MEKILQNPNKFQEMGIATGDKDLDSGEAVSLKTKFCHFMQFGSTDNLLSETMEIGERL